MGLWSGQRVPLMDRLNLSGSGLAHLDGHGRFQCAVAEQVENEGGQDGPELPGARGRAEPDSLERIY